MVPAGAMEWVYAKDAAQGTVLALQAKDLRSRVFNITMGKVTAAPGFRPRAASRHSRRQGQDRRCRRPRASR